MRTLFLLFSVVLVSLVQSFIPAGVRTRAFQAKKMVSTVVEEVSAPPNTDVGSVFFSHIHLYVDNLEDLSVYKAFEDQLNDYSVAEKNLGKSDASIGERQQLWQSITGQDPTAASFVPQNRDVVKQLLGGFGFRVTGARYDVGDTRTVLVTSRDPGGVQIVVTAVDDGSKASSAVAGTAGVFEAAKVKRFLAAHGGIQGIGVLAFAADDVKEIHNRYKQKHPDLIDSFTESTLEVFAYYKKHDNGQHRIPDTGTILRFMDKGASLFDLGLSPVPATFEDSSQPAYCDHWVSNVFDRTEFLDTLEDALGFTPKVDFNAGVVAAGEAQIESTVTGNASPLITEDRTLALKDQSQVYLPINNALSSVGHVHGFLQELGQGVQHVASRVEDLVAFVQRANEYRQITGEGFTFLRIPRSYYGVLTANQLREGIVGDRSDAVSEDTAEGILNVLRRRNVLSLDSAVDLSLTKDDIGSCLEKGLSGAAKAEYDSKKEGVLAVILRSRYRNLHSLLGQQLPEESYLGIVRNQILVDIQGNDLLYQIFTANILQRKAGEEAPFFEFIQRVCAECVVKPGCGGFGIRNFLTLFLSIEVSKAMQEVMDAKEAGDDERERYAQKQVDYFTEQLNESNPILTEIADAMTEEGHCKERMEALVNEKRVEEAESWRMKMEKAAAKKQRGNAKLMECSARYNDLMKSIRQSRNKA